MIEEEALVMHEKHLCQLEPMQRIDATAVQVKNNEQNRNILVDCRKYLFLKIYRLINIGTLLSSHRNGDGCSWSGSREIPELR